MGLLYFKKENSNFRKVENNYLPYEKHSLKGRIQLKKFKSIKNLLYRINKQIQQSLRIQDQYTKLIVFLYTLNE